MFHQIASFVHAHINSLDIEMFGVSLTCMVDGKIGNVIQIRLWDINHQYNTNCVFHISIK